MVEALTTEQAFFEEHRKEWNLHHRGKFALVRGRELRDIFDTPDAAYAVGIATWGNVPFLIKQILDTDPIEQIPVLAYGLVNGHLPFTP